VSLLTAQNVGALADPFVLQAGRRRRTRDLWLDAEGTPLNETPFVVPFDCRLVAVVGVTATASTWALEVYRQPFVRPGGTPTALDALTTLSLTGTTEESSLVSIELDAGDELGIFCRGTAVDRPKALLYLERR
jgi:hypothetical protein